MAFTPDLPPGARPRMWILTGLTCIGGGVIYFIFGRLETLFIAALVLGILLYLLLGVELTLRRDQQTLAPMVQETLLQFTANPESRFLILLDREGMVLWLSALGQELMKHDPEILIGQRFADLFAAGDTQERRTLIELLRFASLGHGWTGELSFVAEDGSNVCLQVDALPIEYEEARKHGFVALGAKGGQAG